MQNPVKRNKRHATKWEKIFANHISVKGLYPQYMKNSIVKPKPIHFANVKAMVFPGSHVRM